MARAAEEDPRVDPIHRRTAGGPGLSGLRPRGNPAGDPPEDGAQLHGQVLQRPAARDPQLRHHPQRHDEAPRGPLHGLQPMPGLRGETSAAGVALHHLRGPRHRADEPAADEAVLRDLRALCRRSLNQAGPAGRDLSGEGHGGRADRHRPVQAALRAARPRPGLPDPGAEHADALAGGAAAPAARDPGGFEPVRRGLRPRRTLGGTASGRHRGAVAGARRIEGRRQFAVRRRTRAGRGSSRRLGGGRGPGRRRARRRGALQRPARRAQGRPQVGDRSIPLRRGQVAATSASGALRLAETARRDPQQPARRSPGRAGCCGSRRAVSASRRAPEADVAATCPRRRGIERSPTCGRP